MLFCVEQRAQAGYNASNGVGQGASANFVGRNGHRDRRQVRLHFPGTSKESRVDLKAGLINPASLLGDSCSHVSQSAIVSIYQAFVSSPHAHAIWYAAVFDGLAESSFTVYIYEWAFVYKKRQSIVGKEKRQDERKGCKSKRAHVVRFY